MPDKVSGVELAVGKNEVAGRFSSSNRFLERLVISNYKSIESADIGFAPLTFLVGPNGSGKSNVLDAIAFMADSLARPLDHALRDRGGINEVRRRSSGHPTNFGLRAEFRLPSGSRGHYSFEIAARTNNKYIIKNEECVVVHVDGTRLFRIINGRVESSSMASPPAASSDRLYLVNVSGTAEFREAYDSLSSIRIYNISPSAVKSLQEPSAEPVLSRDGSNITTIYGSLVVGDPDSTRKIEEYLATIVPGIRSVDVKTLGPVETLEFKQIVQGAKYPWRFIARNMSDGTLRAFGILVALFQEPELSSASLPLIGIEEPEVSLHPAALRLILESLYHASKTRQIIVTSHSPDLLADQSLNADSIRAVVSRENATSVVRISETTRRILIDGLYSAGELLRMNKLEPDPEQLELQRRQMPLFG